MLSFKNFLFFFVFSLQSFLAQSRDQGQLHPNHIQVSQKFIEKHLQENKQFSVIKIREFLERLETEQDQITADHYETIALEDIEIFIHNTEDAHQHAHKKIKKNRNKMTAVYQKYLIPKTVELLRAVENNPEDPKCWDLTDDIIRGYTPFYIPNAHRSRYPYDIDVLNIVKRMFTAYTVTPKITKTEASNLRISSQNHHEIQSILGPIEVGSYLSADQVQSLAEAGFDISKLDPGISALWENPEHFSYEELTEPKQRDYPLEDEKVQFEEIRYRGAGSVKFKVSFLRHGKKTSLKLKIGLEVHTDMILSRMHQIMGFNQDRMTYAPQVKMWLGDVSYEDFLARVANKYGVNATVRWINGHGEENGEEWVLLNDVIFETRPEEETRVTPFDISAWDLANRREYRSLLLVWAWLGLNDSKLANFKFLLAKEENESYKIKMRFHDQGVSLGGRLLLRKPNDILSFTEYYKVDSFPETFLETKKKNKLLIKWNDFGMRQRNFHSTTWHDLKWAARKIAKLSEQDIEKVLRDAGTPDAVAHLYAYKLKRRRNEIVESFGLQSEYPLFPVVANIKNFHAEGVKSGKVMARTFEGHNDQVITQKTWLTLIPSLLTFDTPVQQWSSLGAENQIGFRGFGVNALIEPTQARVTRLAASPGLGVLLWRKVLPNIDQFSQGDKAHIYRVEDILSIEIGASVPRILESILQKIPGFSLRAHARLTGYEIRVIRYVDKDTHGWKLPFPNPMDMLNPQKYAAMKLNPLEIIGTYLYYGPHLELSAGVSTVQPLIQSSAGVLGSATRHVQNYYMRDQYGQIHAYQDRLSEASGSLSLDLATLDLFEATFPLFRIKAEGQNYRYHFSDQVIPIDEEDREQGKRVLTPTLRAHEYTMLKKHQLQPKWDIKAKGSRQNKALGTLFLFNFEQQRKEGSSTVRGPNNLKKRFWFTEVLRNHSAGAEKLRFDFGQSDVLVENRKKTRITTEASLEDQNILHIIRVEDFYRTRTKEKIERLIGDLNRRFSNSYDGSFYRNYEIPSRQKESKYRKIYAMTRVFIDGQGLQEALQSCSKKDIKAYLWEHFHYTQSSLSRAFKVHKSYRLWKKIHKNKGNLKKKVHLCEAWLTSLKVAHYGVKILEKVIGHKNLYVMGDIAGILQSYSTTQDLQMVQRRRFAAKSWGQANVVPPLQKFLRYERVLPPTSNVSKLLQDTEIFGRLEVGTAGNIQVTFDRSNEF